MKSDLTTNQSNSSNNDRNAGCVLIIEGEKIRGDMPLSRAIAKALVTHRAACLVSGYTVVIVDKPANIMPRVRKYWLDEIRLLENERSGTVSLLKSEKMRDEIEKMHSCKFAANVQPSGRGVFFVQNNSL